MASATGTFGRLCLGMTLGLVLMGCGLRSTSAADEGSTGDEAEMTQAERDEKKARAYMAEVERRARRRHVDVVWMRPPNGSSLSLKDQEELRRLMRNQPPVP